MSLTRVVLSAAIRPIVHCSWAVCERAWMASADTGIP